VTPKQERQNKNEANTVRTYTPKPGDINRQWHVIDATDVVLGRLASQTAILLRGKHKATFAPHMDMGDSGYPGGLTSVNYAELLESNPVRAVEKAIKGMLPKNSLAAQQLGKLKVYRGAEHPHAAQQPKTFEISQVAQ
jgi:large subunit ribosomal protein L13